MSDQKIRINEIPAPAEAPRFGAFTSAVSATAIFSLLVMLLVTLITRI